MTDAHDALRADPDLGPLVEEYGELTPANDYTAFERLSISVVNQLISTAAAETIRDRLFERVTVTPEGILAADRETLREVGLSPQKVDTLRNLAVAFREGRLSADRLAGLDDEAAIDELTAISGVGTWTAKMALIFVLERPDVFPVEDLGIRRGMELLYGDLTRAEMRERAADWRPYRTYASLYLWQVYEDETMGPDDIVA